uniref:Uncharacterized protein n=1 Tax=Siphoviridae sp. ctVCm11 TaxID=2826358 RepID=A0A8S5QM65_9CAUD|nr:MAG TPA: hypothetical protein [Siphoviridae sp. ctVCm11]
MVSDEALKKLQEQIAAWPMTQRFVVQQLIEDYRMDREDLRAYKATGLTPEEVERSKLEIEAGCVKAIARTYGIDINRLRKLAEADKDGRLVGLPCKVGTATYYIHYPIAVYPDKSEPEIKRGIFTLCDLDRVGHSVFLTREEAEKALEAMKNGN